MKHRTAAALAVAVLLGMHPAAADPRHDPLVLGSRRFGVSVYDGRTGKPVGPLRIAGGSPFGMAADAAGSVYVQTFDRISQYRPRTGLSPTRSWRWDARAGQLVGVTAGRLVLITTTEALLLSAQGSTLAHARTGAHVTAAAVDPRCQRIAVESADGMTAVYEVGPRSLMRRWTSRAAQPTTDVRFTTSGTLDLILTEGGADACVLRELSGDSGRLIAHRRLTGSRCTTAALAVPARYRVPRSEVVSDVAEDARGNVYVATDRAFIAIDRGGTHRYPVTPGFQNLVVVDP